MLGGRAGERGRSIRWLGDGGRLGRGAGGAWFKSGGTGVGGGVPRRLSGGLWRHGGASGVSCQQSGLTGGPLPLHPLEGAGLVVVREGRGGVQGEGTHQVVLVEVQNLQKRTPRNN